MLLSSLLMTLSLGQVAPAQQREILVLTSSTNVTPDQRVQNIVGYEIQNLGPNDIFCNIGNAAVLNKSRRIATMASWGFTCPSATRVYCIASTAAQVTGAATIVTAARRAQ